MLVEVGVSKDCIEFFLSYGLHLQCVHQKHILFLFSYCFRSLVLASAEILPDSINFCLNQGVKQFFIIFAYCYRVILLDLLHKLVTFCIGFFGHHQQLLLKDNFYLFNYILLRNVRLFCDESLMNFMNVFIQKNKISGTNVI